MSRVIDARATDVALAEEALAAIAAEDPRYLYAARKGHCVAWSGRRTTGAVLCRRLALGVAPYYERGRSGKARAG
jgi:hypothetical protein